MTAPSDHGLSLSVDGHIAWLGIDRPERLNALPPEGFITLAALAEEADSRDDVRALVVSGTGGRAFCAGIDIKAVMETGKSHFPAPMKGDMRNSFERVLELSKPTIACLEGVAMGAGAELAMACDIRMASDTTRFAFTEAKVGMGANFASVMLPRLLPRALALELLYTGRPLGLDEGARLDFFNRVLPAADLRQAVRALAATVAANAPLTIRRMKETATKCIGLPLSAALRLNVGPDPYSSADRVEGLTAFLEKRPPEFSGH